MPTQRTEQLTIVDSTGRPRIILGVTPNDDHPRITVLNATGKVVWSMEFDNSPTGFGMDSGLARQSAGV